MPSTVTGCDAIAILEANGAIGIDQYGTKWLISCVQRLLSKFDATAQMMQIGLVQVRTPAMHAAG
jgi:hypothetical protein